MIYAHITKLIDYGLEHHLLYEADSIFARNQLLHLYKIEDYYEEEVEKLESKDLNGLLTFMLDYAYMQGLLEDNSVTSRDYFEAKIMNILMPRPSQVIDEFYERLCVSKEDATKYYYRLSRASNYIKTSRISKNIKFKTPSKYGDLDITINLAKPEKDPRKIMAAMTEKKDHRADKYPKCFLCKENEGYAGNANHPARDNHRIIPVFLNDEKWFIQYSPYVYYNEHCIVFSEHHYNMKIHRPTFIRLIDFVDLLPHYFLGSNAGLPIVGGSILTHDHYQGGNYEFPINRAKTLKSYTIKRFEAVSLELLDWPISVIKLSSSNKDQLVDMVDYINHKWTEYSDESIFLFAETENGKHNAITPICRKINGVYEYYLALRNNITTEQFPDGVYHPHPDVHHIKKENIGLIEVMGLAVLPGRLNKELSMIKDTLLGLEVVDEENLLDKHMAWIKELKGKYESFDQDMIDECIKLELGKKFERVLQDAGIFKDDLEAFSRFIDTLS